MTNDTLREELGAKVRERISDGLLRNGFTVDHLDYECTAVTARHVAGLESVALDLLATNRAQALDKAALRAEGTSCPGSNANPKKAGL